MRKRAGWAAALVALAGVAACGNNAETSGAGGHGGQSATASSATTSTTDATSTSSSATTTSSTTTTSSSSGGTGGGTTCVASNDTMLAADRIYYGDTNFDDTPNTASGWKQFGFDLDGVASTAASTGLCQLQGGASPNNVYPDGTGGIDNSFGKNILPIFLGLMANFSTQANATLTSGKLTLLIKMGALGAAADQAPIVTKVYAGAPLAKAPEFDTDDCWPVTAGSVTDPTDVESAKLAFATSTLTANHWDSVTRGDLTLGLTLAGSSTNLVIHQARMTMDLDPGHQNVLTGMIGGVLKTEELVTALTQLLGDFDPTLCSGPTAGSIVAQIRQASDILADGTQDPTKTCDGISIGLGFKAAKIGVGGVAPPVTPPTNPCGP